MSKPDKHTPLSTEELFKLLDNTSGKATDFDDMDEFEKDALEGFTAHTTPEKARALLNEVHVAISQKASGVEKENKRSKVIWFSAAASIALLIILSVFFLNESKNDTVSDIALNDLQPAKTQGESFGSATDAEVNPATKEPVLESAITTAATKGEVAELKQSEASEGTKYKVNLDEKNPGERLEQELAYATEKSMGKNASAPYEISNAPVAINTVADERTDNKAKEELKEVTTTDKLATIRPQSAVTENKDQTVTYNTTAVAGNASPTSGGVLLKNADAKNDTRVAKESAKKRAKTSTDEDDEDAMVSQASLAGGESAVRDFVMVYLKEKELLVNGKYKVKAIVHTTGKLRVTSVVQISKEKCDKCIETITKVLNTMGGWTPATWDNKPTASTVEFVLEF